MNIKQSARNIIPVHIAAIGYQSGEIRPSRNAHDSAGKFVENRFDASGEETTFCGTELAWRK